VQLGKIDQHVEDNHDRGEVDFNVDPAQHRDYAFCGRPMSETLAEE
jgi:hypothetical protein